MYEVVSSFTSAKLGYLNAGRELSEWEYGNLTPSERAKVQRKWKSAADDSPPYYPTHVEGGYSPTNHSSYDDTPSHNDTFGGFGGGESGGGGADGGWSDAGGGDGGGGGGD